ncbi:YjcZ family sporulation protein [Paenibacillus sp. CAA11]|nr:YjcZ family sporulation protein [Paenibacillus sp. CAA11]
MSDTGYNGGGSVAGIGTSAAAILVLFILLVIISKAFVW